jgi:hypothetical protein
MRFLPALVRDRSRWTLPMSDRSAAALAELLLAHDPALAAATLAGQLARDPPLVVWAVCLAAQRDGLRVRTVAQLAQWLAPRAIEVLQWEPQEEAAPEAADHARVEGFADRVAAALALADLAAQLAQEPPGWDEVSPQSSQGSGATADEDSGGTALRLVPPYSLSAQEAYFDALLYRARDWLDSVWTGRPDSTAQSPWDALEDTPGGTARRHVERAAAILADQQPPEPAASSARESRRRGAEGRQMWLEAVPGAAAALPVLAARLARLGRLERQFHETLESEKLASLAEFAAGAGHEINNPLAIIAGRAQLLLKDEPDAERRRELALINAQVKRAHEMIADLWLFARPPRPEPQTVDLVGLVDRVIEEFAPQAAERGVSIRRVGSPGPLEVQLDPVQLSVALHALCKNSLEAMGRNGQIDIALGASQTGVEITVADTGPGITPQQRRHIFDPFYSARQAGRGLGMGLSKCWRIVTNHGGRISVQNGSGEGARFVVSLPRVAQVRQ